jgi:hypothetical protein
MTAGGTRGIASGTGVLGLPGWRLPAGDCSVRGNGSKVCSLGPCAGRRKHKKKDKKRGKDRERGRERERQRKRRWEDMAHADERNRVSLADLWRDKGNKTTMFFDRVGDRDNLTYGHPSKMEVPFFRVDEWWTGGAVRARRAARNMLGLRATRPGAPDGARGAWRYLRPAQAPPPPPPPPSY